MNLIGNHQDWLKVLLPLFLVRQLHLKWLAIPLMLILISAIRGVGYLIGTYCLAVVSNYLVHSLRVRLFNSYLYLPFSYYDKSMSGNLISTVTFNVQQVTEAGTKALKTLLQQGSLVIGLLAYLIYTNWILTLFFICATAHWIYC